MKKIYQKPIVNIVAIQTQQMIAESIGVGANYNGTTTVESRRRNDVWDDDDY